MNILELDHVALYVADAEQSIQFYRDVLELEPLPRPAFDFPGAWFSLGGNKQLHLLGNRAEPLEETVLGSRKNHFAVKVADMEETEAFLRRKGLTFRGPKARPDGIRQIFLQDPDGYWLEFNE
ncbi:glyoxalase [Siphonobacter sp. BAB-5385]|uniref:VOC family protein n=1 Tax=unclassified Siphonobacter TaxID=2635712 RepID=UPI000B9E1AAA|nr:MULTISPECIES: VOC family protein [unclassified Siphonobacter]OZI05296.1 glyoxalase [Siphonobacter sp. BAB-5385]PMD99512.1 glyoxalase [Siphonobacter sp. BAB-5405]